MKPSMLGFECNRLELACQPGNVFFAVHLLIFTTQIAQSLFRRSVLFYFAPHVTRVEKLNPI